MNFELDIQTKAQLFDQFSKINLIFFTLLINYILDYQRL